MEKTILTGIYFNLEGFSGFSKIYNLSEKKSFWSNNIACFERAIRLEESDFYRWYEIGNKKDLTLNILDQYGKEQVAYILKNAKPYKYKVIGVDATKTKILKERLFVKYSKLEEKRFTLF